MIIHNNDRAAGIRQALWGLLICDALLYAMNLLGPSSVAGHAP
jgi:hypothetical protein